MKKKSRQEENKSKSCNRINTKAGNFKNKTLRNKNCRRAKTQEILGIGSKLYKRMNSNQSWGNIISCARVDIEDIRSINQFEKYLSPAQNETKPSSIEKPKPSGHL